MRSHCGPREACGARARESVRPGTGQDRAAPAIRPVHRAGELSADGHHAAPERRPVGRLDEEVGVRALQGVVHDAEVPAVTSLRERALERPDDTDRAQRR